jgi:uncharacterized protein YrzB (UPF0473 family)
MKEQQWLQQLKENELNEIYILPYYNLNDKDNVELDEESIREEFEEQLKELKEILNAR